MTWTSRRTARLALPLAFLLVLVSTRPLRAQALQTLEGVLTVVWGDPHPDFGGQGEVRYTLVLSNGTHMSLVPAGHEGEAVQLIGKRVIVSARVTDRAAAAASPAVAVVDSFALSPTLQASAER